MHEPESQGFFFVFAADVAAVNGADDFGALKTQPQRAADETQPDPSLIYASFNFNVVLYANYFHF